MASGLTGLERLIAIDALVELQARRVRALDKQDWAAYRECHAQDFVSHTTGAKGLDATVAALQRILEGVTSIHRVVSPDFSFSTATEARGSWMMEDRFWWVQGADEHWMHGWGVYHDTYAKRDGRWLFTSRRLERQREERSAGARL